MSHETFVQPSLNELLARYLGRQAEAQNLGIAAGDAEVVPYEAGPVQPLDSKLAWDEGLAVLSYYGQGSAQRLKAPPHWAQLVAGHASLVAIPFCTGNFPQLMRSFHEVLTQPTDATALPAPGRAAIADDLQPWVDAIGQKKQFPHMLLAVGALRLANHLDAADAFVEAHDGAIPAEWRAAWDNEKAALAWHAGRCDEARRIWDQLGDAAPALFNRGMSALFLGDTVAAKQHLNAAVRLLPSTSAWHHLGRLYLTLADLRA